MPRNLFYTNGQTLKSIDLPQYPDESWDWISGEPDDLTNEDLYSRVAAVYRAANMTANALANLPFALVDKSGEDYDVSSDWQNKVGFMPDPKELLRLWRLSLFFTNSAYGFMEGNRAIKSLRYIVPSTITPIVDTAEGLQGFKRTVGTTTTKYTLKDRRIFWMWRMDHTTELLPSKHTEFRALMAAAGVLFYSDYFIQNFFQRGGIKPTMLMVKGIVNPTDREKIENIWDKVVHGWHKYLGKIFNADAIEPHVIGDGIDNLKDSALHNECIADIAMAAGIPLSLLLSNSANYATAQTEYMMWFRDHIPPWADFMGTCLNEQLFNPLGLHIDFRPEMSDPGQEDEEERAGAYRAYVSTGMKPSVAAQILGLELPPGMEYDDLDPKEEEQPSTDEPELNIPISDNIPMARAKFIPTLDQFKELELWQSLAFRKLKRGDDMAFPFELKCVPEDVGASIRASLAEAQTEEDVRAAFDIGAEVSEPGDNGHETNIEAIKELAAAINGYAEKYSPDQPRVPAGDPEGGQWTSGGSAVGNALTEEDLNKVREALDMIEGVSQAAPEIWFYGTASNEKETREAINKAFEELNSRYGHDFSKYIENIVVCDSKSMLRTAYDNNGGSSDAGSTYAFYNPKTREIFMPPMSKEEQGRWASSLTHEVGHAISLDVDYKRNIVVPNKTFESWYDKWESDPEFDRMTGYSTKNAKEGFAETFSLLNMYHDDKVVMDIFDKQKNARDAYSTMRDCMEVLCQRT